MSDQSWMRRLDDWKAEQVRERAANRDPHHPQRRTKGEKRRNRSRS
jgi:hypothetical protein